jgi:hypothetical protein
MPICASLEKNVHAAILMLACAHPIAPAWADTTPYVAESVEVVADRLDLVGTAATSSQGVVDMTELSLLPACRPGQLLETVPGLAVTAHSGEGKANQICCAVLTWTTAPIWAFSLTGCRSTNPATRMARAIPT